VARIRVPGGRLRADQLLTVLRAAPDGTVELTSRGNLQVRGVDEALGELLAPVGLLPSATHERVRNIVASPLGDVGALVRELDRELCARPGLAELPGRFLFAVDDGRGDVAWLDADVAVLLPSVILLGGVDVGLRVPAARIASTMLACAERFLEVRTDEWRLAELVDGPRRVASGFSLVDSRVARAVVDVPVGVVGDAVMAAVPLGRLTMAQGMALASASDELVITPWRSVVVPGGAAAARRLAAAGLLVDPGAPGVGVSACTGRPGCAKALADVRADALAMIASGARVGRPVHWSGCARRCGRPHGEVVDVVATEDGYTVRQASE
jgi:precorrin-3B synthase